MWVRPIIALLLLSLATSGLAGQESPVVDRDSQIGQAGLAAPPSLRAAATVLGYGGDERPADALTVLREGTNSLICLADDPAEAGFHVACYHRSLDEFMALGRRLRMEGKGRSEIMDARYAALEAGSLVMPERAALFSLSAEDAPDDPAGARRLAVLYVPGATAEELGLPAKPDGDAPWLMLPGTPWAHVMIGR